MRSADAIRAHGALPLQPATAAEGIEGPLPPPRFRPLETAPAYIAAVAGTAPIAYRYVVEGHDVVVSRRHIGAAYARNGNAHNPTEHFVWDAEVDGRSAAHQRPSRSDAYEHARAQVLGIAYANDDVHRRHVNVRSFVVVQAEMRANYRGRLAGATALGGDTY